MKNMKRIENPVIKACEGRLERKKKARNRKIEIDKVGRREI